MAAQGPNVLTCHLLVTSRADGQELGEVKLRDAAADDLLQAVGKVAHQQRLHAEPEVLHAPAAPEKSATNTTDSGPDGQQQVLAAAAASPADSPGDGNSSQLPFVRLYLSVPDALLWHCSWRRSADAATLFKQLFTCDTDLGVFCLSARLCVTYSLTQGATHQHRGIHADTRATLSCTCWACVQSQRLRREGSTTHRAPQLRLC